MTNGVLLPPATIEIYKAHLLFGTSRHNCWYLDSYFCSGFHRWSGLEALLLTLSILAFFAAVVGWGLRLYFMFTSATSAKQIFYRWDFDKTWDQAMEEAARWSMLLTTILFVGIFVPLPMYSMVFKPCFSCFDFEAAAVHELGHVLGLGHPNTARAEVGSGYAPPGDNVYQSVLASEEQLTGANCQNPWLRVANNTPPSATLDPDGCYDQSGRLIASCVGVRPSVMLDFAQFRPMACLQLDDLEAIQTVYPDCEGSRLTPSCTRTLLNLGLANVAVCVLVPVIIALLVQRVLRCFISQHNRDVIKDLRHQLALRAEALAGEAAALRGTSTPRNTEAMNAAKRQLHDGTERQITTERI